jgi:hypothetical protein
VPCPHTASSRIPVQPGHYLVGGGSEIGCNRPRRAWRQRGSLPGSVRHTLADAHGEIPTIRRRQYPGESKRCSASHPWAYRNSDEITRNKDLLGTWELGKLGELGRRVALVRPYLVPQSPSPPSPQVPKSPSPQVPKSHSPPVPSPLESPQSPLAPGSVNATVVPWPGSLEALISAAVRRDVPLAIARPRPEPREDGPFVEAIENPQRLPRWSCRRRYLGR